MYSQTELTKMVFFDLETASTYATLEELKDTNPKMAELWIKRCDYIRNRFEENKDMTDSELYEARAGLTPEFSRIICASFGRVSFENDPILGSFPKMTIKSYASSDEKEVLDGITTVFEKFATYKFVGHNIKRFDVPMMCKRILMAGRPLPKGLQLTNLKPWEMPLIDTSEVWSFGAWQEGFASLELLATSLGLETPKDDIRGDEVSRVFWQEKNVQRIADYCQKDVFACAQILLKLSNLPIVQDFQA